ncbi:14282_t:CDS:2 [Funneliformis caledonium]|uniref:14282_t:CDS:1 n=1 Tax=Funneliformis caledonium TaxID=1117310 RepID=A0A9N8VLL2_9GLOM|nr:14282_t:CDS:2 [Funneliformis caledonium]
MRCGFIAHIVKARVREIYTLCKIDQGYVVPERYCFEVTGSAIAFARRLSSSLEVSSSVSSMMTHPYGIAVWVNIGDTSRAI